MPSTIFVTGLPILLLILFILICLFLLVKAALFDRETHDSDLPVVNRYRLDLRIFAKLRWAFNSRNILNEAYKKYKGTIYKVDRGDIEVIVIPPEFMPELNSLPESVLSSRMAHSYNLLGHLNGVRIVEVSGLYFKIILNKVTAALPNMTDMFKTRLGRELDASLPQESDRWTEIEPLGKLVYAISSALSMISVPAPLCDDPRHIQLLAEHASLVFGIFILMGCVPRPLQSLLVWLLPAKWKLEANLKSLRRSIIPEAQKLLAQKDISGEQNMLSWSIQGARNSLERNPEILTQLQAVTASGATHSVGLFIANALFDLVAYPTLQDQIRTEIQERHVECDGIWDFAAYNSLLKLDSMLKETARVGPPSMTVYSRILTSDFRLSNGVFLKKGQMICVSSCSIQSDEKIFPGAGTYRGLRTYEQTLQDQKPRFCKDVDSYLTWGGGRWACPGRFLAVLEAKIIIVKLLAQFDLQLLPGRGRPEVKLFHSIGFIDQHEKLMARRRKESLQIGY